MAANYANLNIGRIHLSVFACGCYGCNFATTAGDDSEHHGHRQSAERGRALFATARDPNSFSLLKPAITGSRRAGEFTPHGQGSALDARAVEMQVNTNRGGEIDKLN